MKEITDPISVFEEWLENMRKNFEIKNFKEFREEMFSFAETMEKKEDISKIVEIVYKYMRKK